MEEKELETVEKTEEELINEEFEQEKTEQKVEPTTVVQVKLNVNYETLTKYNLYFMKHVRHFTLIYIIMIVLALAFSGYVYFLNKQAGLAIVMLIFAGYMVYSMLTFDKSIDKQLTAHFRTHRPVEQVYTFTNLGFTCHTEGREDIDYDWSFVSKIHVTNEFYYLFLGKTPLIIDRNPNMIISGSSEELDKLIEEIGSTKPIKRFNKPITNKPVEFDYPDYDAMDRAREEELEALRQEEAEREALEANETIDADAEVVEEEAPESLEEKDGE